MHFSNYDEYLNHPLFKAIRAVAIDRADGRCVHCGAPASEVHHVRYPKPWGTFDVPENLDPICHACHCKIHGKAA
jgi:5-methylcytosine-specific restriction endonuclease McrA